MICKKQILLGNITHEIAYISRNRMIIYYFHIMSEDILRRSKLLCYFQIDDSIKADLPELYIPEILPLSLFHFHYPALYFPTLFTHFKPLLPENITENHLRLKYKGEELPVDLPIGLFVENYSTLTVCNSQLACPEGFKLMMINWKKGYTIVNKEGGCDHVFKKLNQESQRQLYNLHFQGYSHDLHKIPKYQGNAIALRLLIGGVLMQRKQDRLKLSVGDYLKQLFGDSLLEKALIFTHGIQLDLNLDLKELLQQWNYNDGFCYLKIVPVSDQKMLYSRTKKMIV